MGGFSRPPVATLAAIVLSGTTALGQQANADSGATTAHRALGECLSAAGAQRVDDARQLEVRAETRFRATLALRPQDVEAIVGFARTLVGCLLPAADLSVQGELSDEAIALLERAPLNPRHWPARFTLASIYYYSPDFLGRGVEAAEQLDELLRQETDRTEDRRFARAFEYRGTLWMRGGRPDSALSVWARGLRLFAGDSVLRALVFRGMQRPPVGRGDGPRTATTGLSVADCLIAAANGRLTTDPHRLLHVVATVSARSSEVLIRPCPPCELVAANSDSHSTPGCRRCRVRTVWRSTRPAPGDHD